MEIAATTIVTGIAIITVIAIVMEMMMMKLTAQRKREELTGLDIEQVVMILGAIIIMTVILMIMMIVVVTNANYGGYPIYFGPAIFNNL